MKNRSAYYSSDLKSWVRMEQQEDGEWCHTSGFGSIRAALTFDMERFVDRSSSNKPLFGPSGLPSFLEETTEVEVAHPSPKKHSRKRK